MDMTGAKHSDFDQLMGSRFPRATMQYLARTGILSTYLIVEIAIEGRIPLHLCFILRYSFSVIVPTQKFLQSVIFFIIGSVPDLLII